ncbi:hypothetical protein A2U01_0046768, partial [Trifolium medium]|nr:hypothetical protein [Trifolium medium]
MQDFMILKALKVNICPPKSSNHQRNYLAASSDGAALGSPGLASCGGLFRNCAAEFI